MKKEVVTQIILNEEAIDRLIDYAIHTYYFEPRNEEVPEEIANLISDLSDARSDNYRIIVELSE